MATVVHGHFEWDERTAAANLRKHRVAFEEASTTFADPCYIVQPDAGHVDRFFAIGVSGLARMLTVVHVERGLRVRIISARKATKFETQTYERRRF
jgi:hypothetical protein